VHFEKLSNNSIDDFGNIPVVKQTRKNNFESNIDAYEMESAFGMFNRLYLAMAFVLWHVSPRV